MLSNTSKKGRLAFLHGFYGLDDLLLGCFRQCVCKHLVGDVFKVDRKHIWSIAVGVADQDFLIDIDVVDVGREDLIREEDQFDAA